MKPPLMPAPYPDEALNALFTALDHEAAQLAARDPHWPVSEAGQVLFVQLMGAAMERAPEHGFDAVLFGIAGGMPPEGRATALAALQRLDPAHQQRGLDLFAAERQQLAQARTAAQVFNVLGSAIAAWHSAAETLGPGASEAFGCGLVWIRLHQRHDARVFLLPTRRGAVQA